jgi:hypothetical protein
MGFRSDNMKYCNSTDEETFSGNFDTREEAVAALPDKTGWTAECTPVQPEELFDADMLVENMQESLCDIVGEAAETFAPTDDEIEELQTLIADWITEVGLGCFTAMEIKRHEADSSV